MRTARLPVIVTAAALLLGAPPAFGQATDAEFKCEQLVDRAEATFFGNKLKCIRRCWEAAWSLAGSSADCVPPYGGATAECIDDTVLGRKGAENKFEAAIKKACDPATNPRADCPECYDAGDCSSAGFATYEVQFIEGQIDNAYPGVVCEPGANVGERICMLNVFKAAATETRGVTKCYDKCQATARTGAIPVTNCDPIPVYPTDPATLACLASVEARAAASIDKSCALAGNIPDCNATDDYPSGTRWAQTIDAALSGNQPPTYCE